MWGCKENYRYAYRAPVELSREQRQTWMASAAAAATGQSNSHPAPSPAQLLLQCPTQKLVLGDVYRQGRRVAFTGVAASSLIGKRVNIVFAATHKVVAHTVIAADGSFSATALLPAASLRGAARYRAVVKAVASPYLALTRRLVLTSAQRGTAAVSFSGYVTGPLAKPLAQLAVSKRTGCGVWVVVGRGLPAAGGAFHITTPVPAGTAVYRLQTTVRASKRSHTVTTVTSLPVVDVSTAAVATSPACPNGEPGVYPACVLPVSVTPAPVATTPAVQITSHPGSPYTSASATFAFSSDHASATFQCSLDGGAYTACTTPTDYSSLAVGSHTFAVKATSGGLTSGPATFAWTITTSVTALAAGTYHSCALVSSGTVKCWGLNEHGQLGDGTTALSLTAVAVSGISTATALTAGNEDTCAMLSGGTVKCWGLNGSGELGNGTTSDSSTPVAVSGISTATAVSAGGYHTCALLAGGTVKCWGFNAYGQLGNGTTTGSSTPVAVSGISTAIAISAGEVHSCALLSGGTVECWGNNGNGELGNGTTTDSSTPVTVSGISTATALTAGAYYTCAVLSGGTVK